jgi:hypothetical protein
MKVKLFLDLLERNKKEKRILSKYKEHGTLQDAANILLTSSIMFEKQREGF